jgi:hypothetical protein
MNHISSKSYSNLKQQKEIISTASIENVNGEFTEYMRYLLEKGLRANELKALRHQV